VTGSGRRHRDNHSNPRAAGILTKSAATATGTNLAALALLGLGQTATAETDINFTLDWKYQGPTAALIVAKEKGYFDEEDLDVAIDSGNGSAGAVTRVASGAYQMGFADINALVEFNAANPGQAVQSVMMLYDAPPFGLYALKSSGISKPEDLVGRTLGAPVFDASYKLLPAFASQTGIDPAAVPRINMDPPLREAMLVRGEVDVISGHYFSSLLDLMSKGVPRDDIVVMLYADHGMDFYGNALSHPVRSSRTIPRRSLPSTARSLAGSGTCSPTPPARSSWSPNTILSSTRSWSDSVSTWRSSRTS